MSEAAPRAVVIGASAGALEALLLILPALPADFPLPVLVVVHLPPDRDSLLPQLLSERCALRILEAEDKQPLEAGTAYFAPPDYHLLVEKGGWLALSSDEAVLFSRPSIDVLFESAADAYGAALVGIILSGANHDGAQGLRAVCQAGGLTLVQDPTTALSPVMPRAALAACPQSLCLAPEALAAFLVERMPT